MHSLPVITDGSVSQVDTLAALLADAFEHDPVMNWVIPAKLLYPAFFRLLLRDIFLPRGMVHLDNGARGAALWLPPGEKFDVRPSIGLARLIVKLLLREGPAPLLRLPRQGALFERHHPDQPHYHLLFIGCRQASQGSGIGSALLKHGTRICDQARMPAYLESSNEANLSLYQRHGFEVIATEPLPGSGPRVWFMWRERRAG